MDLPIEVLIYLFKYLPHSDRIAASQTCKLWYEAGCDISFVSKKLIHFSKIFLQNDLYPSNIFGPEALHKFSNFCFEEMDMSNQVCKFWNENGYFIKCLKFDNCDMQEKAFISMINSCPNLEELTIVCCRELFMSARQFDNLKPDSLKCVRTLNLPSNRYLSDSLFDRLASSITCLQELDLSDCPVSFHPGLYKKYYPLGDFHEEIQPPSESVLTFYYVFKILKCNAQSVKKLSLTKTLVDGNALKAISELPNLKLTHMYANRCDQLNVDGLISLSLNQINLIELDIGKCTRVTNNALISICNNLTNLKYLCINGCKEVDDTGIAELWKLKHLERVNISENDNISGEGIKNGLFQEINYQLCELNISCIDLEVNTIISLSEMLPNLKKLDVSNCFASITDVSIQFIFKNLLQLDTLLLHRAHQVSDVGLTGMGIGLKSPDPIPETSFRSDFLYGQNSQKISLRSRAEEEIVRDARRKQDVKTLCESISNDSDRGYSIGRLKSLKYLDISACNRITDVSLKYAFDFLQLKHLDLSECQQITHEGLEDLAANCPSIERIELRNCFNTRDEGVKVLARKLHRLKHLNLSGCNLLTDSCIWTIKCECKCLHFLDIQGCRNISPDLANSLSCIPTLHTILISKPGPYITEGQQKNVPLPPSLSLFAKFKKRIL